ncbi:MAG: hypothetical protein ACE10E_13605, partial [Acidiferrobacterales bacterium]
GENQRRREATGPGCDNAEFQVAPPKDGTPAGVVGGRRLVTADQLYPPCDLPPSAPLPPATTSK